MAFQIRLPDACITPKTTALFTCSDLQRNRRRLGQLEIKPNGESADWPGCSQVLTVPSSDDESFGLVPTCTSRRSHAAETDPRRRMLPQRGLGASWPSAATSPSTINWGGPAALRRQASSSSSFLVRSPLVPDNCLSCSKKLGEASKKKKKLHTKPTSDRHHGSQLVLLRVRRVRRRRAGVRAAAAVVEKGAAERRGRAVVRRRARRRHEGVGIHRQVPCLHQVRGDLSRLRVHAGSRQVTCE